MSNQARFFLVDKNLHPIKDDEGRIYTFTTKVKAETFCERVLGVSLFLVCDLDNKQRSQPCHFVE